MPQIVTIKVYWKDKFDGQPVKINAEDFDATRHRLEADGPWPQSGTGKGAQKPPEADKTQGNK